MYIQQLYTNCLSEAAYYIESNGEAAVIDPVRDTAQYLQLAKERNAEIKYIFETHFHADFISGHLDLSQKTGAPIIYGPQTTTQFKVHVAADGECFPLGKVNIKVLHTPGHTIESSCYLLQDEKGKDHAIFTGDTLFVGDVGRPDLSSGDMGKEELAAILYKSLQEKIMPLADDVIVYPAHGAGSSCGKNLGKETYSTIGEQKQTNYALLQPSREAFIQAITEGLQVAPKYFPVNARINRQGYESLDTVLARGLQPLNAEAFSRKMQEDVTVLDTRSTAAFTEGFVPGSISIGLEGRFAEWAGSLLPFEKPILLVTEPGREEESVTRLARVGFSDFAGYLAGGFKSWLEAGKEADMIINVEADEMALDIPHDPGLLVVDVRKEIEFADGHVKGALNLPLNDMTNLALIADLDDSQNLYIHCAGGYRSVVAASLLKKEGYHNLRNVLGGWAKIKEEKSIVTEKETNVLN